MKKLMSLLFILTLSLNLTSCDEQDAENIAKIAALTYLYSATYSHYDGGSYYYRTQNCNVNNVYYGKGTRTYVYCRYYSAPDGYGSGYYVTTSYKYDTFDVYRR